MDGNGNSLLQPLDKGIGGHGQQQVCHILDANDIRAHLLQFLGQLDEIILVVDGGNGVRQGGFHNTAVLLRGADGLLQIAHIVERVENADDVDAVFDGLAAESIHYIVGIVLIAEDVLPAEEHLQLGVGQGLAQLAQALPRVFLQKAHTRIKGSAAPAFQRPIADRVQHLAGGQHVLHPHPGGCLRLVGVTQDGIGNIQGLVR